MRISAGATLVSIVTLVCILSACASPGGDRAITSSPLSLQTTGAIAPDRVPESTGSTLVSQTGSNMSSSGLVSTGVSMLSSSSGVVVDPPADSSTQDEAIDTDMQIAPIPSRWARVMITPTLSFQFPFSSPSRPFFFSRESDGVGIHTYTGDKNASRMVRIFSLQRVPYAELEKDCRERIGQNPSCRDAEIVTRLSSTDVLILAHPQDGPSDIDAILGVFGPQWYDSVIWVIKQTLARQ